MARTWRCAVVGTGVVGEWHVKTIPNLPNAKLVAVCDIDPAKTQSALEKNKLEGIPQYTSLAEMLRKESLDVVHVCNPSGAHGELAMQAMEAGVNVISEKPLEITLEKIDRMIATAHRKGVRVAGIFQNRWSEANRAVKAAADEGRFGKLSWAGSFTPWYRPDKYYEDVKWRGTWALDGGGAIMNQSVHAIDLLQWIMGPVKRVSAYGGSRIHPSIETEDTLTCSLEFASGVFGTIVGSTAMYPGQPVRMEIGGENGTTVTENGLKLYKFRDERSTDKELLARLAPPPSEQVAAIIKAHGGDELYNLLFKKVSTSTGGGASNTDVKLDLHTRNIQHILTSWDEGRDADTHGPEARKAVAIVLAMYESVRKGGDSVDVK